MKILFYCLIIILILSGCEGMETEDYYLPSGYGQSWEAARECVSILENKGMFDDHPLDRLTSHMESTLEINGSFSMFLGSGSGSISGKTSPELFVIFACQFQPDLTVISILPLSKVDIRANTFGDLPTIHFKYRLFSVIEPLRLNGARAQLIKESSIIKATIKISTVDLESNLYLKIFNK